MSNLATKILDEIQKEMKIDAQWMSRNSNSLTWVAHKLEQTFSVSEPFAHLGKEAVAVESRIPVALHVKHPKEQVCDLLCQFNYTTIGSAYVFDANREEVFSSLKVIFTEADLAERCWQVRTFALFQMIMVKHQAPCWIRSWVSSPPFRAKRIVSKTRKSSSWRQKTAKGMAGYRVIPTTRLLAEACAACWHYPWVTNLMSKPPWMRIMPFNWGCGHVLASVGVFQIQSSKKRHCRLNK